VGGEDGGDVDHVAGVAEGAGVGGGRHLLRECRGGALHAGRSPGVSCRGSTSFPCDVDVPSRTEAG
jgi:hypothetical protein